MRLTTNDLDTILPDNYSLGRNENWESIENCTNMAQSYAKAVKDSLEITFAWSGRSNTTNTWISKSFKGVGLQMFKHLSRLRSLFTAIFSPPNRRFETWRAFQLWISTFSRDSKIVNFAVTRAKYLDISQRGKCGKHIATFPSDSFLSVLEVT